MTRYETLKEKPARFLSLTGYTLEEFSVLLPFFKKQFQQFVETQTLDGKDRKKRRYTLYKNSSLPSSADQLLFILLYLRKAPTQDVLGELFGMSQPVANKWIHRLLPVLNCALSEAGELPMREVDLSTPDAETTQTTETDAETTQTTETDAVTQTTETDAETTQTTETDAVTQTTETDYQPSTLFFS